MKSKHLTKSKFVMGQRCQKALHLDTYHPELQAPLTPLEQKTLQAGNDVNKAARQVFPEGMLIESRNTEEALIQTQKAVDDEVLTLFEPAFRFNNLLIRVDILTRSSLEAPWDFFEVKATTYHKCTKEQKEEYLSDVGVQVWVLQRLGIPLGMISLMHLNRGCRYPDLSDLFVCEDYSELIQPVIETADQDLKRARDCLANSEVPSIAIGKHCEKPRSCPFISHCWKDIPKPSIFEIPRNLKKWEQFERGTVDVDQLHPDEFRSDIQKRVLSCYQDERRYFDKSIIGELLNLWSYPFTYLDFEAIDYPIPKHPGTRPYQHIPFQFSAHIQRGPDRELEHFEFLWESTGDPRPTFIRSLIETVPDQGPVIAYYNSYESTRLRELASDFPEFADKLDGIRERLVDLMDVIQKGVYYPEFMGSFSIKKVAPAILGEEASYANLQISDGIEAMLAFDKLVALPEGSRAKSELRTSMLSYCEQDTLLMVKLHRWLLGQVSTSGGEGI